MAGSNKSTDLMKNANDVTADQCYNGRRPIVRVIVAQDSGLSPYSTALLSKKESSQELSILCEVLPSAAARESTLRGAKLSGPLTTTSYIYLTLYSLFYIILLFSFSFSFPPPFCLLLFSREVPSSSSSHRGRLYIYFLCFFYSYAHLEIK